MDNAIINHNWKDLIKPSKLNIKSNEDKSLTTVIAEPLEKGYALTIGNSLRRILLSSIQGSAITAIQIDGVLHEFSSIKGVREDVTDIVLNVKLLSIQVMSKEPKKLILDVKGPGEIKARDIQPNPDVKILNPDLVLCHLDENTKFYMELIANRGKGYHPAEKNKKEDAPLGLIAIDSLFSPVKKVSYTIENAREGQALDYDKLVMNIETNGSLPAEDAVAYAARIFQDQLSLFVNFEENAYGVEIIAVLNGRYIGSTDIKVYPIEPHKGWTGGLGVLKEFRRKGIATALKIKAIEKLLEKEVIA